jgi:pimeloyl-ACP methyl ester carboxylesterase
MQEMRERAVGPSVLSREVEGFGMEIISDSYGIELKTEVREWVETGEYVLVVDGFSPSVDQLARAAIERAPGRGVFGQAVSLPGRRRNLRADWTELSNSLDGILTAIGLTYDDISLAVGYSMGGGLLEYDAAREDRHWTTFIVIAPYIPVWYPQNRIASNVYFEVPMWSIRRMNKTLLRMEEAVDTATQSVVDSAVDAALDFLPVPFGKTTIHKVVKLVGSVARVFPQTASEIIDAAGGQIFKILYMAQAGDATGHFLMTDMYTHIEAMRQCSIAGRCYAIRVNPAYLDQKFAQFFFAGTDPGRCSPAFWGRNPNGTSTYIIQLPTVSAHLQVLDPTYQALVVAPSVNPYDL